MSEQDVRDGLWAAVSGEPPLSFDPDALMARADRDLRRRRALVGVGVATTAVAVAAVAVPTVLGSPRGSGGAPQVGAGSPPSSCAPVAPSASAWINVAPSPGAPTTKVPVYPPKELKPGELTAAPCGSEVAPPTSSTPPIAWPAPNVTPRTYTRDQLVARGAEMQSYLRTQFAKVVPGATMAKPGTFGGEQSGQVSEGQAYLNAFTVFMKNGEQSAVDIYLSAPGGNGPKPCDEGGECDAKGLGDGSWIVIQKHDDPGDRAVVSVLHFRADGSVVRATGYNYDPTGADVKVLKTTPVTAEQLTALATDPKLSL
jgi:hypothetical protein